MAESRLLGDDQTPGTQLRQAALQASFHRGGASTHGQVLVERATERDEGLRPHSVTHTFRIRLEQHCDALLRQRLHDTHHIDQRFSPPV